MWHIGLFGYVETSGIIVKDLIIDKPTINCILGRPAANFVRKNADINGDGQILVDDAVGTVNLIMSNQ